MRKIYLMLLCAVCVSFVCCGDDKTIEPTPTPTPTPTQVEEEIRFYTCKGLDSISTKTFYMKTNDDTTWVKLDNVMPVAYDSNKDKWLLTSSEFLIYGRGVSGLNIVSKKVTLMRGSTYRFKMELARTPIQIPGKTDIFIGISSVNFINWSGGAYGLSGIPYDSIDVEALGEMVRAKVCPPLE